MASGLLPDHGVRITTSDLRSTQRREDLFDRVLRWVHRLLNPPRPAPVPASAARRPRRVRDRVPI
ncbi:MAG: hypothetical protein DMF55_06460 [Acidobacteria bacterium]|nr:MAG: hypothetical protein DMF55_06460 [Acidobacteriota bacterium]